MCVLVTQSCLTLCNPHRLQPARLLCPWNSPDDNTGVGCHSLLQGGLPDPRIESRSPEWKADSLAPEYELNSSRVRGQRVMEVTILFLKIFVFICLFGCTRSQLWHAGSSILVGASRIFSCTMCNLVPPPGIEPGFPALGVQSLSHWTTREVLGGHYFQ